MTGNVAQLAGPFVTCLLRDTSPVRIEFWDGSTIEPTNGAPPIGTLRILSPDALRRLLWSPNELGLGRAYVAGDIEAEGEIVPMIEALRDVMPATRSRRRWSPVRGSRRPAGSA